MPKPTLKELPKYPAHVIDKLIGIKGNTAEEVLEYIIISWVSDHWQELESYGISVGMPKCEKCRGRGCVVGDTCSGSCRIEREKCDRPKINPCSKCGGTGHA